MVPSGWERKPLIKVADVRTGAAKGKKGLKDPIEVPYLRVANVQDGYIDLSEVKTIQIERHHLERYSLQAGDVLMTEGGDFDKLGRGDVWKGQIEPCLNQNHVFAVRVDQSVLIPSFLAALSGSHYGKTYFLSCAKRSTNLASINSTQLKEFPVLIPPLPEQRKIAKILSTWDKAIAKTEKLIETSKQQKKALMQQLLTGKKRLVNPETGKAFEGEWEEVKLRELGHTFNGLTGKTKEDFGDGAKYIPYINIFNNSSVRIDQLDKVKINRDEKQNVVKYGDVFFTTSSETPEEVGMSSVILVVPSESIYLNSFCFGFRPNNLDKTVPEFMQFLLRANQVRRSISVLAQGATRYNLSKIQLLKISVNLPNTNEQQKIASVLTAADKEIETLETKLAHFKQEKKALMQQLLTGKRRVKVDELEEVS
ncbi:restriction endonuclease subunit S [Vibrio sp. S9_S30]|uniref:restriction endonuclease subunit S n=1 Tax=Vibrio sp. S9_S30 TaxID=2720226 RepID=UPI001680F7FE|nr:restriction endonuclease subunit S [Vibrio sp. S9_S30]MBD1558039.1 restriction endonuclease subunit S [Vibrio sp. S9_S30]